MARTKQWTQRDGTKIRVCDMTTSHLRHACRMMEARLTELQHSAWTFAAGCRGDMATYYAEQDAEHIGRLDPDDVWPIYADMKEEIHERETKDRSDDPFRHAPRATRGARLVARGR